MKYQTEINQKLCKRCLLCLSFCPKKVLIFSQNKIKVENQDACLGCRLCEKYCPELAISIEEKDEEK